MDVIAIFGPTGVGKTAVAVALAQRLRARGEDPVAVSADALQVYRGLETLTGAATAEQQRQLEHRLLSFVPVTETFSAGRYAELAHAEIDALLAAGRRPIVVGGHRAVPARGAGHARAAPARPGRGRGRAGGQDAPPTCTPSCPSARRRWRRAWIPPTRRKLARSLALLDQGIEYPPAAGDLWTANTRRPTLLVALTLEREALDAAIDARVDAMVAAGAADEVRAAAAAGASPTARQALGFEQLLAGDVEAMKQRTRRYARRQLTWLRKLPGPRVIDVTGRAPEDVAADIDSAAA